MPAAEPLGQGRQNLSEFFGAPRKTLRPFAGGLDHTIDDHIGGERGVLFRAGRLDLHKAELSQFLHRAVDL